MVIDESFETNKETSEKFWQDELKNLKILLIKYNQAISALLEGGVAEYTLETGQSRQTVKRTDLNMLYSARSRIMGEIATLESRLKVGGSRCVQMAPGW